MVSDRDLKIRDESVIIKIEIENFYSIREKQVLDFRLPLTTPDNPRFSKIADGVSVRVPKVIAFFGANASGKTTFLRAASFLCNFVERSFNMYEPSTPIDIHPFQRSECSTGTTTLAMEFSSTRYTDLFGTIYRYELSIQHIGTGNFVSWEALRSSNDGVLFRTIFERTGNKDASFITASEDFGLPEGDPRRTVRANVSLLSSLVQFAHAPAQSLMHQFRVGFISNIRLGKTSLSEDYVTRYLKDNPSYFRELNRLIRVIDVGIEEVQLSEEDKKIKPIFLHSGLEGPQTLQYESQGTKNFYCLFPMLIYSLKTGGTAILDEIDSDLHPALMWEIIRWYHSDAESPFNAQLIVSCQNPSILAELEKEEVCLVEKSKNGESSARRLSDFGYIRRDTNLYKKYLGGAFGAVPNFG
jgi:hypothetical protein